jgi:hypothetical protein
MKTLLPEAERKALRELLDAALQRSDAGSIVPRSLPSETMFMLMFVHLRAGVDEPEGKWAEALSTCVPSLRKSYDASTQRISRRLMEDMDSGL